MTPEEASRIRRIWDEFDRLGALRGDPWSKIRVVAPAIVAEIGAHISFSDIAEAAGNRADNLYTVLTKLADADHHR